MPSVVRRLAVVVIVLFCALSIRAQSYSPILQPHVTYVNSSGLPCVGCSLYTYAAGTSTPQATYSDCTTGTQNTNPVILDVTGGANICLGSTAYKFVLKDALSNTLWTVDNIAGPLSQAGGAITGNLAVSGSVTAGSQSVTGNASVSGTLTALKSTVGGNLNATCSVTFYGAVGDCTGSGSTGSCTDNTSAIQNAVNACFAFGGTVYFPSNSAATTQTVYYVAGTVNPKGVSMSGPAGASGPSNFVLGNAPVGIRGAPGKDVFAVGDPTSGGYVHPKPKFSVRDLAIIVDDSVDASSSGSNSFPNRFPGRFCFDAGITSSSAVLTSSTACIFQPGDVGQAIQVNGAGTSGANLVTTVASWQSATQVTLTASASTTVTNAKTYIAVMNMSVTQTLGNCGWAYDDTSSVNNYGNYGMFGSDFTNVVVTQILHGGQTNHTCGFMFQSDAAPYQTLWSHDYVQGEYAFAFIPANGASTAPVSPQTCGGICDFNKFDHVWISGQYPFTAFGGDYNAFKDVQISGAEFGPEVIAGPYAGPQPYAWEFDIPEIENQSQVCNTGDIAFRLAGQDHIVDRFGTQYCPSQNMIFQWDASQSQGRDLNLVAVGTMNISGSFNTLNSPFYENSAPSTWNVTGAGNTFTTGSSALNYNGVAPGRAQFAGNYPQGFNSSYGVPQVSRSATAFNRTHDFIDKGAANYFFNSEDLWFWPKEVMFAGGPSGQWPIVADSTSPTGYYTAVGTAGGTVQAANGTDLIYGKQVPAGKIRYEVMVYADASVSGWTYSLGSSTGGFTTLCSGTANLTTTPQLVYCDADSTSYAGTTVFLQTNGATGHTVKVQWWAIRPWDTNDISTAALTLSHTVGTGDHAYTRRTTLTASLSPVAVAANTCAAQSLTVTGIQSGDIIINGSGLKPTFQAGLSLTGALVTGANTVSMNFCNNTASPITPTASETYTFDVEQ